MWVGQIIDPAGSQEDEAETENYKAHLYSEENVSPKSKGWRQQELQAILTSCLLI